ncbi:MAG: AAA family ATPase [Cyclobacteriaceae bacterium]
MKILKIHFKNINSLKGEHSIHFDQLPLASAGIFAITGNTGSGKTTLLDVISLALFNRVPRIENKGMSKNEIDKTGSILTQNTEEAFASVTYQSPKGTFTSRWSIRKAKTGTLQDYHMEVADEQNIILNDKKREVPGINEELIGLSYEQFIRSMMLAQGEFTKFLKSKKEDRDSLLEKITGTEIYRRLGRRAFEKSREHKNELDRLQQLIDTYRENLIPEEEQQQNQDEFDHCEKEKRNLQNQIEQLKEALRLSDEIDKLSRERQKHEEEKQQADQLYQQFEAQHAENLDQHRALIPLQEGLRQWNNLQQEVDDKKAHLSRLSVEIAEADTSLQATLRQLSELTGQKLSPENALKGLEKFRDELSQHYNTLERLSERQQQERRSAEQTARQLGEKLPVRITEEVVLAILTQSENREALLDEYRNGLSESEQQDPQRARQRLQVQTLLLNEISNLIRLRREKESALQKNKSSYQVKESEFLAMPDRVEEKKDALHRAEQSLQSLRHESEKAALLAKYEADRRKLVEGEACFLCGSNQHPYVEHYQAPAQGELQQQISRQEKEVNTLRDAHATLRQELQSLKKSLEDHRQEASDLEASIGSIRGEEATHWQQIDQAYRQYAPKDGLALIEAQMKRLDDYTETLAALQLYQNLYQACLSLQQLDVQIREQQQLLSRKYQGQDYQKDCRSLGEQFQERERNYARLQEQQRLISGQMKTQEKTLLALEADVLSQLRSLGYTGIRQALDRLMPAAEYDRLLHEKNELKRTHEQLAERLRGCQKQLEELRKKAPVLSKEELELEVEQKQQLKKEVDSRRDELFALLQDQLRIKKDLKNTEDEYAGKKKACEKWVLLGNYIGDSVGKKFSNFAQQLTLQQLVALANRRLQGLTDRYELDLPRLEEDAPKEDDTLIIIDHDMGDIRRSVRTLSGGETFLVSLALALGLSDLASRNVDIQSLFIDEGFGTLDPETLDQTLDTLEKLQAESEKVIGVISHVGALKERIGTRIEVHKNGQGYSRLKVVTGEA